MRHCAYCGQLTGALYACYAHRDLAMIEAATMHGRKSRRPVKGKGSSAMQADKVEAARKLGLVMGSLYKGSVIGWTTNEALAGKASELGLQVTTCYNATGPQGWEIVALPDPENVAPINRTNGKG